MILCDGGMERGVEAMNEYGTNEQGTCIIIIRTVLDTKRVPYIWVSQSI